MAQTSVSVVEYSYSHSSSSSASGIGAVDCFVKGLFCGVASVGPPMGENAPRPPNMSITVCDLDGGIVADTVWKTWSITGRRGEVLRLDLLIEDGVNRVSRSYFLKVETVDA